MTYEGKIVLNYKLAKKLGEGGFGAVYLAEHTELGRRAAIKILHHQFSTQPQMVERFFQEARAVCAINHRAIIAIENYGRLPDTDEPFYLMEFFPGGSLTQIASDRWLNSDQLVDILDPIADALGAAHAKNIIHRDLKPDNVMARIANDKVVDVRLLDFGIAKLLDGQSHSMTGSAMGTPAYMPPEQALDAKNVDVRADVYSFGATVYSAIAGRPPFEGSSVAAVLLMVQTDTAALLQSIRPEVPPALDAAIRRCMAKQREHRPSTIADAWQTIRGELVRSQLSSNPAPPGTQGNVDTPVPMRVVTPLPARDTAEAMTTTPATSPEVRPKSKLPLILSGVGVVAVVGIVIAIASSGTQPADLAIGVTAVAATPDAANVAASVTAPGAATVVEKVLAPEEVIDAFGVAVNRRLLICDPSPDATKIQVRYQLDISADGSIGGIAIDGTTTPAAECVRKALEKQPIGIRATRTGGSFEISIEMPTAKKVAVKPVDPKKPPEPKPPDPKPIGGCSEPTLIAAANAASEDQVEVVLKQLAGCRGKLDAVAFRRIQQILIAKS